MTVKDMMQQRLQRGTPVVVADSLALPNAKIRGKELLVASTGPVKCNKGGRCEDPTRCIGLAVFLATPEVVKKEKRGRKRMGWRKGAAKLCITWLSDTDGNLILPKSLAETAKTTRRRKSRIAETNGNGEEIREVSWSDLAEAYAADDIESLSLMARSLKAETESLKSKVIAAQDRLIESLAPR